jgi:hypothetical protein
MDYPENLATQVTQDEEKYNATCVLDTTIHKQAQIK